MTFLSRSALYNCKLLMMDTLLILVVRIIKQIVDYVGGRNPQVIHQPFIKFTVPLLF